LHTSKNVENGKRGLQDKTQREKKGLALLFRIREISVSNLCPETGYPEVYYDFPQYLTN
jgi:hypothetical protein